MEATTRKLIRDYAGTVIGAVLVALLIRIFIIEAYRIPTSAMRPTLEPGDTVFVAKSPLGTKLLSGSTEHGREPSGEGRGDVILFHPDDPAGKDYIKRIVALAGDTVELRKGKLFINGSQVTENIAPDRNCGTTSIAGEALSGICYEPPLPEDVAPIKIPEDSVFVLGDFRSASQMDPQLKGKSWGVIPKSWIKGRALWVWLSVEPPSPSEVGVASGRFPKVRFERMFRRIR